MLKAERAHGIPTMVIAMTTAATTQPTAIHRPPNTIQSKFNRKAMGDIAVMSRVSGQSQSRYVLVARLLGRSFPDKIPFDPCSDLKNAKMPRTIAKHGHSGLRNAVQRLVAITLAWHLLVGVGVAQTQTKSDIKSEPGSN